MMCAARQCVNAAHNQQHQRLQQLWHMAHTHWQQAANRPQGLCESAQARARSAISSSRGISTQQALLKQPSSSSSIGSTAATVQHSPLAVVMASATAKALDPGMNKNYKSTIRLRRSAQ